MNQYRWDSRPTFRNADIRNREEMWSRAFLHDRHVGWEGTWIRDFDELRRRDLTLRAIGQVTGRRILYVACGNGLYMVVLAMLGASVAGQDISEVAIREAEANLARYSLKGEFAVGTATELRFPSNHFDALISADFVEHISREDKTRFFREAHRVLKPGGLIVVKTPNRTYLRLSVFAKRIVALMRGRSPFGIHVLHTRGNPDYEHHGLITHHELGGLLLDQMFHSPEFVWPPLSRRPIPRWAQEAVPRTPVLRRYLAPDLIACAQKPIFLGIFP